MSTVSGNSIQHTATLDSTCVMVPARRLFFDASGIQDEAAWSSAPNTPSAATNGAGSLTGDYSYIVVGYDSRTDTESPDSASSTPVTAASNELRVTRPTGINSRATHWRIYRNLATNPTLYKFVADVDIATSTYDDDNTDAAIDGLDTLQTDNDVIPSDLEGIYRHAARLFAWKGSNLYWSKDSQPEYWPALNVAAIARGDGADIKGVCSVGDQLAIFKEDSIHRLGYEDDPVADGWFQPVMSGRGALCAGVVADVNSVPFVMDEVGVYVYRGSREIVDIGAPVQDFLERRNLSVKDTYHVSVLDDRIEWYVALDGDLLPRYALVFDLRAFYTNGTLRWWCDRYDHSIVSSCTPRTGSDAGDSGLSNQRVPLVMDSLGFWWFAHHLTSDGIPNELVAEYTISGTANPASNTVFTCAPVANTSPGTDFDTASYTAVGSYLRTSDDRYPGPYRVTAVSGLTVTIDEEITDIAGGGAVELWVGGIHQEYHTPRYQFDDPHGKKQFEKLMLNYEASPIAFTIDFSVDRDDLGFLPMSSTVTSSGYSSTRDSIGVAVYMGGNHSSEGGRGSVALPPGLEHSRTIAYRFESTRPNRPISLIGMSQVPMSRVEES